MKILSLLIALTFTGNVLASTSTAAIEELIDSYRYEVEVEWDQKDKKAFEKIKNEFVGKTVKLISGSHLSAEDLVVIIQKKIKDPKQAEAVLFRMQMLSKSSPAEMATVLASSSEEFYSRGASWEGDTLQLIGIVVAPIVLGLLLGLYLKHLDEKEAEKITKMYEGYSYECYGYGYATECTTSGSSYGSSWNETTSCAEVYQCLSGGFVKD